MPRRIINIYEFLPAESKTFREPIYDCENHEVHLWRIVPGEWIYPHTHPNTDDLWYIVQGQGEYYTTAKERHAVATGCLLLASPGEVHGINNCGEEDMIILSVLAPLPVEVNEAAGFIYPGEE